jgi:voltage-gated potassium channel
MFWFLTFFGNLCVAMAAYLMLVFEKNHNAKVASYFDALWWAFCTVTTVGYGDITPLSSAGRIVGIALMIVGTALFGAFTALFAAVMMEPELMEVELGVKAVEQEIRQVKKEVGHEEKSLEKLVRDVEKSIYEIRQWISRKT